MAKTTMTKNYSVDDSNVGEGDVVLGQDYFGSVIVKVKTEVDDSTDKYKIKRFVTLQNGTELIERYWRDKSLGEMKSEETALPIDHFKDEPKKDDSDARARARALLAARRKGKGAETKLPTPPPEPEPEAEPEPESEPEIDPEPEPEIDPEPEPEATSIFDGAFDPIPATVVPESKLPETEDEENVDTLVTGVWKHDDDTDDTKWESMDVVITKEEPKDLDPADPHGIVAVKEDTKPNAVGKLKASALVFFTPGTDPPPTFKRVGHWGPGKLKSGWPPGNPGKEGREVGKLNLAGDDKDGKGGTPRRKVGTLKWDGNNPWMSNKAVVFPRQRAPEQQRDDDGYTRAVWKAKVKLSDDHQPQKVDIYPLSATFGDDITSGVWGVDSNAIPDSKGEYSPKDLLFYPPDEEPESDECEPAGKWAYRKDSADKWPPPKSPRVVGKLPAIWKDRVPPKAVVYPRRQAPKKFQEDDNRRGIARGIWKFKKPENEDEQKANEWMPHDVQMYEDGDEPADWRDDEACGVWGMNPTCDAKDSKPSDLLFYPPGEEPDEGFEPMGKWKNAKKSTWPPKSVGKVEARLEYKKVEKKTRNVGKLKVPAFLQGK